MNLPVEAAFTTRARLHQEIVSGSREKSDERALGSRAHDDAHSRPRIVDADVDVQDPRSVAWFVFNNLAPDRDLVMMPGPVDDLDQDPIASRTDQNRHRRDAQGRVGRLPREWPPDIVMDDATKQTVSRRWRDTDSIASRKRCSPTRGADRAAAVARLDRT